jgi:hypothetical protein
MGGISIKKAPCHLFALENSLLALVLAALVFDGRMGNTFLSLRGWCFRFVLFWGIVLFALACRGLAAELGPKARIGLGKQLEWGVG